MLSPDEIKERSSSPKEGGTYRELNIPLMLLAISEWPGGGEV